MKRNSFLKEIACLFLVLVGFSARAQCTATTLPYYEDFQSITANNQLPACWAANSPSASCLTFTTPGKFAAFNYNPAGTNYFYSRGLQLITGVTYSAALFYKSDFNSGSNSLSIMYGNSQSATGLISIASIAGPASSTSFSLLSGLFNVPTSGVYYIAVRGIGSGTASGQYLNWDDLSVKAVCAPVPPVLTTPSISICSGQSLTLTAPFSGPGPNIYLWNTGATTSNIVVSPPVSTNYSVLVTNSLTGCPTGIREYTIGVSPSNTITIFASSTLVCSGHSVQLAASGTAWYAWSNGAAGPQTTVYPTANITYSVIGSSALGCPVMATINIGVLPSPTITINASSPSICKGQSCTLVASGALSYTWSNGSNLPMLLLSPNTSTLYTLTGVNAIGCTSNSQAYVTVLPLPILLPSASQYTICRTEEVFIDCSGAATYTWTSSLGTTTDTPFSENPLSNTIFTVNGTNIYGCVSSATLLIKVDDCAGIRNTFVNFPLQIYPNPGSEVITIKNSQKGILCIFDVQGRLLSKKDLVGGTDILNITNLPSGLYYLKIQSRERTEVLKIVKE